MINTLLVISYKTLVYIKFLSKRQEKKEPLIPKGSFVFPIYRLYTAVLANLLAY